ncbi:hypothetical protein [Arthrobacter cryoconiti]|uniref:Uncharacterized protein n=1 Tax=Arthrobacter cryoconiti TaxID=748907 RepID=A0ABV8R2B3_9MICC|nr:hypothetical protein [Arthrobacter cryoconiti]MCC9067235.1 hypothetical protein [Arthrobacter cryoconiti]
MSATFRGFTRLAKGWRRARSATREASNPAHGNAGYIGPATPTYPTPSSNLDVSWLKTREKSAR